MRGERDLLIIEKKTEISEAARVCVCSIKQLQSLLCYHIGAFTMVIQDKKCAMWTEIGHMVKKH